MNEKVANSPGGIKGEAGLAPARDNAAFKLGLMSRGRKVHLVTKRHGQAYYRSLCGREVDFTATFRSKLVHTITCAHCRGIWAEITEGPFATFNRVED